MRTTPELEPRRPVLTAADRCDSCGARGWTQIQVLTGLLVLCAHHYAQHEEALVKVAVGINDEREFLWRDEAERNNYALPEGMPVAKINGKR